MFRKNCLVAVLVLWTAGTVVATPVGSNFTYEGQLKLAGTPLSDSADFEFTLWDADVDGNMVGSVVAVDNVDVLDGLFTVALDFGVPAFNGDNRWLEISVRSPAGGGDFTTLDPRQPLTAAPYALQTRGIFVDDVGDVGIGTTTPGAKLDVAGEIHVHSKITSSQGGLTLSGGGWGVRVDLDEDGGSSDFFTISDTGVERFRVEGNTGNVGIGTTNPSATLDVNGTTELNGDVFVAGDVGIGTIAPSHTLTVQNTSGDNVLRLIGPETQGSGARLYFGDANFVYLDESADDRLDIRANSLRLFAPVGINVLDVVNSLDVKGGAVIGSAAFAGVETAPTNGMLVEGNVGIGTSMPSNTLTVAGDADFTGNVGIGTSTPSNTLTVAGDADFTGNVGIGTTAPSNRLSVAGGADFTGNVGIGTSTPQMPLSFTNTLGNKISLWGGDPDSHYGMGIQAGLLQIYAASSGTDIAFGWGGSGNFTETMRIKGNGTVETYGLLAANCFLIKGGCDLAEPFEVSGASVEPGMLVSIDPENPGQLRLTPNAYDTKVAGVVSGAGGLNVGMTLSQEGLFDQGQPVALVGRVYAWCDASKGPIRAGDLLTSSDTPGHAMKVTDRERAFGTTIGKAMSPLKSGKGLVLVLVNLQ